jgi:hypothetical protein
LLALLAGGPLVRTTRSEGTGHESARPVSSRWVGFVVGWASILVGIAGLLWHLAGDFFQEQTLKNLVYTAPFTAPLAYTGLGFLLILDRMVDARSVEWARWVILIAAGGFAGNFILSVADHAQNGFFHPSEWIGVVAAALAVGFLIANLMVGDDRSMILMSLGVMLLQVLVGLLGFILHLRGNLESPAGTYRDRFVYGAPIFAPLLFADLAILAALGLWAQARYRVREEEGSTAPESVSL